MVAALTYCMCSHKFQGQLSNSHLFFFYSRCVNHVICVTLSDIQLACMQCTNSFDSTNLPQEPLTTRLEPLSLSSVCFFVFLLYIMNLTHRHVAIIAFILLLGTFAVGIRCFCDFDRGLQSSKVNCQHSFFLLSDLVLKFKLSRSIPTRIYEPKALSKPVRSCEPTSSSRPRSPSWSQDIHRMMM